VLSCTSKLIVTRVRSNIAEQLLISGFIGQAHSALPITPQAATCAIQYRRVGSKRVCCKTIRYSSAKHTQPPPPWAPNAQGVQVGIDRLPAHGANMRGTELAARLGNLFPEMNVIFMSGYLEHNDERLELVENGVFLEKPFTRESLLGKVNEAFRSSSLANLNR